MSEGYNVGTKDGADVDSEPQLLQRFICKK
jgi:hypothetical protein